MRFLIVDDSKVSLYLLKTLLKGGGYEVVSAGNGAEALKKLRTESIDIIISDVLMPVMDGFKFCKEVKEKDELKNIPFILYTATYRDERDEKLASKLGADKYILKSTEPDELIKIIQGIVRDMEKGKFEPKKPALDEEEEVLKLYGERLVNKLENKMLELGKEITMRKKAEEALRQLTHDLGERVKELSCLYEVDEISRKEGLTVEEVLEKTVRIIPPSWQYPEITGSCITFENSKYKTKNFKETKWMQRVDIIVNPKKVGLVEVCYLEEKPEDYEGPFLKEERNLIDAVAKRLAQTIKQKRTEEEIKASLREKDVLLQEVHHRVKNNMQLISSLFSLQSGRIKDKQAFEIFKSSQNRVRSMALIHERLYQSKDLTRVDFAEYSHSLTTHLFSSSGINANVIKLYIDIKDVFLDINIAIPCGLIINELVTNSLKHAFPNNSKGEIKITMHPLDKNEMELIVSDNGVGIPTEVDFRDTESLGLHLVTILTEDQLHGDIRLKRARGTSFRVRFDGKQ